MTGQIQRELEATRAELRRGVVELPQETQETTANMRRVVADQIKALNELSALVSRSNRVVDAAPAAQPRKAAVNETPVAATMAAVARRRRTAHRPDTGTCPAPRRSPARRSRSPLRLRRPYPRPPRLRRLCARPRRRPSVRLRAGRRRLPARPAPAAAGCRTS